MKNPFDYTSANWVKYSQYEWKKATDGTLYLTPTEKAEPWSYDPLQNAETLVLDALDIALLCFHKKPEMMMFSFMLTDDARPLRLCHECQKPFVAKKPNDNFCCNDCREKYNTKHNQP